MVNADYLVKQRNGHTKFIRLLTLINFSRRITSIWQKIKLSFSFNMIMNIKLLWFSSSSAIMFLVFFFFFYQDPSFLLSVQSSNGRFGKGTTLLETLPNGWTVDFTPMLLQEDYEDSIGGDGVLLNWLHWELNWVLLSPLHNKGGDGEVS